MNSKAALLLFIYLCLYRCVRTRVGGDRGYRTCGRAGFVLRNPWLKYLSTDRLWRVDCIFRYFPQALHTNGGIAHSFYSIPIVYSVVTTRSAYVYCSQWQCRSANRDIPTVTVTKHVFCWSLRESTAVQTAAFCHLRALLAQTLTVLGGGIC
jgi:hypothetical protein